LKGDKAPESGGTDNDINTTTAVNIYFGEMAVATRVKLVTAGRKCKNASLDDF